MFFNLFKSKKQKRSKSKKEAEGCDTQSEHEALKEQNGRSSPVDMPQSERRGHGLSISRMKVYSGSRASSIGHLSVASGMTHTSVGSASSKSSNSSVQSKKSNWSYEIDRFKGPTKLPKNMKGCGYHDVWAQAYSFGGR